MRFELPVVVVVKSNRIFKNANENAIILNSHPYFQLTSQVAADIGRRYENICKQIDEVYYNLSEVYKCFGETGEENLSRCLIEPTATIGYELRKMKRFSQVFKWRRKCNVIGMIHVNALPGTPGYDGGGNNWKIALDKAKHEANIYAKFNVDSVLIENMHDVPYTKQHLIGPEIVASMTCVCSEVRQILPQNRPCGVQILACGNRQAIAVAKAADLQYIRAESFVYGHLGDEGYADACAGDLLRYRKMIDAENVLVLTDMKKKHSSHAITNDVSLLETAKAAEFFLTDGVIVTGTATGDPAKLEDIEELSDKIKTSLLVGSGVTIDNIEDYFRRGVQAVIVGSHFKKEGKWQNELCEEAVNSFMRKIQTLRDEDGDEKTC